jgi:hypothetical protein
VARRNGAGGQQPARRLDVRQESDLLALEGARHRQHLFGGINLRNDHRIRKRGRLPQSRQIVFAPRRARRIDTHQAFTRPEREFQRGKRSGPAFRLARRGDPILQIEDDAIAGKFERLADLRLLIGGDEEDTATETQSDHPFMVQAVDILEGLGSGHGTLLTTNAPVGKPVPAYESTIDRCASLTPS